MKTRGAAAVFAVTTAIIAAGLGTQAVSSGRSGLHPLAADGRSAETSRGERLVYAGDDGLWILALDGTRVTG
jgi:hypothetical protein